MLVEIQLQLVKAGLPTRIELGWHEDTMKQQVLCKRPPNSAFDRSAKQQRWEVVRKADVYISVFGVCYGSIDPSTGLSMTELEFKEDETNKKPAPQRRAAGKKR